MYKDRTGWNNDNDLWSGLLKKFCGYTALH